MKRIEGICIKSYKDEDDLEDFADEEPIHKVELDAFWIYRYEVTNAQYRQCVQAGGCDGNGAYGHTGA